MRYLEVSSCLANPNTWMHPAVKANGFKYYEYASTHIDNAMAISDNLDNIIKLLKVTYTFSSIS